MLTRKSFSFSFSSSTHFHRMRSEQVSFGASLDAGRGGN